jgi:putative spermidine/putrescine transport system substrate-binding protein
MKKPDISKPATRVGRRALLAGAGGLAGQLALRPRPLQAADRFAGQKVVFASWGGAYQDAEKAGYCDPFARKSGATVLQDGPVDYTKLWTVLETGSSVWDVVDVQDFFVITASRAGLLEQIDTAVVNTARLDPKFVNAYGVGNMVFSFNLGYNATAFTNGQVPRTWADFFDLKNFPGPRSLRDNPQPVLESALLGDGVDPKALYPLDVERAFRKLDTVKSQSVFWSSNSQSQQLLVDRTAVMGMINNGRAYDSAKKGAPLAVSWEQNLQAGDYLVIPKGSKHRDVAMALIDEMTLPENQAEVANLMALAPTNQAAFKFIKAEVSPWLSTAPENNSKGILIDKDYWRDNLAPLTEKWTSWKLS